MVAGTESNGHSSPVYYQPPADLDTAELRFRRIIAQKFGVKLETYHNFHRWSCENYSEFWEALTEFADVRFHKKHEKVVDKSLGIADFPKWFEGSTLSYTENVIERGGKDDIAVINAKLDGQLKTFTFDDLRKDVYRIATSLRKFGIGPGETVVGFLPNSYDTTVSMFATAAVGAAWCSASVDFGPAGVLDRFRQVHPRIMITVDSVSYKGKVHDLTQKINEIVHGLPSLEQVVLITSSDVKTNFHNYHDRDKYISFEDFKTEEKDLRLPFEYAAVPFSSPLFIMFSSGTTGIPKAMVQTVGGTLLKHIEEHLIQGDTRSTDRILFYTTCGWMMWNWLMSFLYCGGSMVLYDESPLDPDQHILLKLAAKTECTMIGMGAKLYDEFAKMGANFQSLYNLSNMRTIYSTGSPLKASAFDYINTYIAPGALIASISGGTDIIGCFMGGVHSLPVYTGECQCLFLGMDVVSYSQDGKKVEDEQGELVCLTPFPSMPSHFLGDKNHARYKKAYFEKFDGIWAHGDYCLINSKSGGVLMLGRSDATLNRGGVRIGTAEIYAVVETFSEVSDCIVAGKAVEEGSDEMVLLFVKMSNGYELTDELRKKLCAKIRSEMSPRHVPNKIIAVEDIPYTNSGKKVEIAVKQIINGELVQKASSIRNPDALDLYIPFRDLK